tara:strand:- start:465 stop:884 length:420 start_codon:yes stop_codon:yes gene_type:complete
MPDVSTELILKIQEAVIKGREYARTGEDIYDLDYDVSVILEEAGYPVAPIVEETEPVRPEGSVMWEILVPVTYYRTYHVPGMDEADALDFFHSENCEYDTFAEQEDEVDGEETDQAWVVGPSAKWVNYISPSGEEEVKS